LRKGKRRESNGDELKVRIPREGEVLGIVTQMLGANHLRVICQDGYERTCRIPGKLRKRRWIKEGDVVLVKPWVVQTDERGDVIWRYSQTEANWLRRRGFLKLE